MTIRVSPLRVLAASAIMFTIGTLVGDDVMLFLVAVYAVRVSWPEHW